MSGRSMKTPSDGLLADAAFRSPWASAPWAGGAALAVRGGGLFDAGFTLAFGWFFRRRMLFGAVAEHLGHHAREPAAGTAPDQDQRSDQDQDAAFSCRPSWLQHPSRSQPSFPLSSLRSSHPSPLPKHPGQRRVNKRFVWTRHNRSLRQDVPRLPDGRKSGAEHWANMPGMDFALLRVNPNDLRGALPYGTDQATSPYPTFPPQQGSGDGRDRHQPRECRDFAGFKAERVLFSDWLAQAARQRTVPAGRGPVAFVQDRATYRDFSEAPGPLHAHRRTRSTWPFPVTATSPCDTPRGPRLTRAGRFTPQPDGHHRPTALATRSSTLPGSGSAPVRRPTSP